MVSYYWIVTAQESRAAPRSLGKSEFLSCCSYSWVQITRSVIINKEELAICFMYWIIWQGFSSPCNRCFVSANWNSRVCRGKWSGYSTGHNLWCFLTGHKSLILLWFLADGDWWLFWNTCLISTQIRNFGWNSGALLPWLKVAAGLPNFLFANLVYI